jgi:hypothetical protein
MVGADLLEAEAATSLNVPSRQICLSYGAFPARDLVAITRNRSANLAIALNDYNQRNCVKYSDS